MACSVFLAAQCGWCVGVSRAVVWATAGPFAAGNASGSHAVMRACLCNSSISTSSGTVSCIVFLSAASMPGQPGT